MGEFSFDCCCFLSESSTEEVSAYYCPLFLSFWKSNFLLSYTISLTHMHTHLHLRNTHTCTSGAHTHTHTHTPHERMHQRSCSHNHTLLSCLSRYFSLNAHICEHKEALTVTHTHMHAHSHTQTHSRLHTHTYTLEHSFRDTHSQKHILRLTLTIIAVLFPTFLTFFPSRDLRRVSSLKQSSVLSWIRLILGQFCKQSQFSGGSLAVRKDGSGLWGPGFNSCSLS